MSHYLAIRHDIESDTVYGVYDRLNEAIADIDARRIEKARIEAEARANRVPGLGDPGPYVPAGEYGVDMADIEEWSGRDHLATWERWSTEPWRQTYQRATSTQ